MELHSHHIQVWRSHIRQWQISSRKQVLLPSPTQLNQNPLHHTQIQSSRRQMRQTMMIKANNKKPRRSLVNTTPPERRPAMELGLFIPHHRYMPMLPIQVIVLRIILPSISLTKTLKNSRLCIRQYLPRTRDIIKRVTIIVVVVASSIITTRVNMGRPS